MMRYPWYDLCIPMAMAWLGGCAATPVPTRQSSTSLETVPVEIIETGTEALISTAESTTQQISPADDEATIGQYVGDGLFFCRTRQDKVIALYDMGTSIEYVFGPDEQPELVLNVPREQASTYQWQGIGRYESYSVSIPNGETVYIVSWARDRLEIDQPIEAGVSVEIDGEYVTTVDCATDITHNLIGVDLPPMQF